ncbi:MAG: hypothetical protein KDB22_09800, partial [Planctomycetales bacterium]|nr:hypothetical protein [Planctomycetales bacterium]
MLLETEAVLRGTDVAVGSCHTDTGGGRGSCFSTLLSYVVTLDDLTTQVVLIVKRFNLNWPSPAGRAQT